MIPTVPAPPPVPAVPRGRRIIAMFMLAFSLSITVIVPGALVLLHEPARAETPAGEIAEAVIRRLGIAGAMAPAVPWGVQREIAKAEDWMAKSKDFLALLTPFVLIAGLWGSYTANQRSAKEAATKTETALDKLAEKVFEGHASLQEKMAEGHERLSAKLEKTSNDVARIQGTCETRHKQDNCDRGDTFREGGL